jgi:ABC-type branched-subunit amino acid transport system substrate-binding protein
MFYHRVSLLASIGIVLSSIPACLPGPGSQLPDQKDFRFIIAVVGDGVPDTLKIAPSAKTAPSPNRTQGAAMYQGAKAAFDKSRRPEVERLRAFCRLEGSDDVGSKEQAALIARSLRSDPKVLAVIGHGTSSTTQAGAYYYNQSKIPLLMPIATSPNAIYPEHADPVEANRLHNCFRLPPDDNDQASAICLLAKELMRDRIFLISDVAPDAQLYSQFLATGVQQRIPNSIRQIHRLGAPNTTLQDIRTSVKAQSFDLILFCGYARQANEVLQELRTVFEGIPEIDRPPVVLTDGCKFKDLNTTGFQTFLTFPAPPLDQKNDDPDVSNLRDLVKDSTDTSYQMYGYDALLILAHALYSESSIVVSRELLLDRFSRLAGYKASLLTYSFVGATSPSRYYIYAVTMNKTSAPTFALTWMQLGPDKLVRP